MNERAIAIAVLGVLVGCSPASSGTTTARPVGTTSQRTTQTAQSSGSSATNIVIEGGLGTISMEQVRATLGGMQSPIQECFTGRLETQPYLSGELSFKIRIATDGSVKWVFSPRNTLGSREVEQCISEKLSSTRFPRPERGEAELNYPLVFEAGDDYRPAVAWPDGKLEALVRQHRTALQRCTNGVRGPFDVTIYAAPRGQVATAGVSISHEDARTAATCVLNEVLTWTLPDPGSYPAKTSFRLE